jgi:tetratricopeptide (TPR) repeat protein
MLTGRPPHRAESAYATLELVRAGRITPPRRIDHSIPRDLEKICLKGLAREPGQRYPSAAALAEDLWHFLRGEATSARRLGLVSKGWRWCKRHRLAVGTSCLLLILVIVTGIGLQRWAQERDRESFDLARRTLQEHMAKFRDADLLKGTQGMALREHLLGALPLYLEHARRRPDDQDLQEELGRLYMRLAVVEFSQSNSAKSLEATEQARDVFKELARHAPDRVAARTSLAVCLSNEAVLLNILNRPAEAESAMRQALHQRTNLAAESPGSASLREDLALEHDLYGVLLESQQRFAEAEAAYHRAFELFQPTLDARPDDVTVLATQIRHRFNRGGALAALKRTVEADAEFTAGLDLAEELWKSTLAEYTRMTGATTPQMPPPMAVGKFSLRLGNLVNQEYGTAVVRRSAAFYGARLQADPDSIHDRHSLARSQLLVASMMLNSSAPREDVEKLLREALASLDALARRQPKESTYLIQAVRHELFIGVLFTSRNDLDTGRRWLRNAVARFDAMPAQVADDPGLRHLRFDLHLSLAAVETLRQHHLEALSEIDRALAVLPGQLPRIRDLALKVVFNAQREMIIRDQLGRTDESLQAARQIAVSPSATGIALYEAACILGRSVVRSGDATQKEELAALAVTALRAGFQRGFTEGPHAAAAFRGQPPQVYMQNDPDLAPLRERADFRQLLADVEAKTLGAVP